MLDDFLDSWDRNNTILLNLLKALPAESLAVRPMEGSPTVGQLFSHLHSVRLELVLENAPEVAITPPTEEWLDERDAARIAERLVESARVVREAVSARVTSGRAMDRYYDNPILLMQHLIWHEAYHYGQIKLALKLAGQPLGNKEMGRGSWGVWMRKTERS